MSGRAPSSQTSRPGLTSPTSPPLPRSASPSASSRRAVCRQPPTSPRPPPPNPR
ncbi:MAG: hypothetical protein COY42_10080, partial [Armatimonadetes bacterium CG_4_10_14_0_8_um_filter_66_14]